MKNVYAVGNGKACAYGSEGSLFCIVGPDYSSADAGSLELVNKIELKGRRIFKTAVFEHTAENIKITDFARGGGKPVVLREIEAHEIISFNFKSKFEIKSFNFFAIPVPRGCECYLVEMPAHSLFYRTHIDKNDRERGYLCEKTSYMALLVKNGECKQTEDGLNINIKAGRFVFAFSPNPFEAARLAIDTAEQAFELLKKEAVNEWESFYNQRQKNVHLTGENDKMADDIAVMIKAQQSESGGVYAGYRYRLCYIRDSYGVNRGLLKMGCYNEAKALINYFNGIFLRKGELHTAQGTDRDSFHIHEHDESEITGYMGLMVFDYYEASGDAEALLKCGELIKWCAETQHKTLNNGMLPFNGDETYIAGGILSRVYINDGSAEATALYHRLLEKISEHNGVLKYSSDFIVQCEADKKIVAETFVKNFIVNEIFYVNNPHYGIVPKIRPGVRMCGCGMGYGILNGRGAYVCPDCLDKNITLDAEKTGERQIINSTLFTLILIKSGLLTEEFKEKLLAKMAENYLQNGILPSTGGNPLVVGYDYGLFLLALHDKLPECRGKLRKELLSLRDVFGAYSEYYLNGEQNNTLCRPWESALNICGLLS